MYGMHDFMIHIMQVERSENYVMWVNQIYISLNNRSIFPKQIVPISNDKDTCAASYSIKQNVHVTESSKLPFTISYVGQDLLPNINGHGLHNNGVW